MDTKSLIGTLVMLILFIAVVVWRYNNQNELKKNGVIVSARIIGVNLGGKTSGGFQCRINFENKELEIPSSSSLKSGKYNFIGKTFPAKYLSKTNTLEVLIAPVDFEKFNMKFPDSLNWVLKYVIKD